MTPNQVLWVYIALLLAGGLIGFLKAKSKMSLIMSVIFAIPLVICAIEHWPDYVADIFQAALLIFFGWRFAKTKKITPAGIMLVVTLLALILRHTL
jgi:uncharacterized membrane protein (UPF0136 family)